MKGLNLPIKVIVVLILAILVLFAISSLIFSESLTQISRNDAMKTFNRLCEEYKQHECSWSLTKEPVFTEFWNACKIIYGDYRSEYSCLYKFCCMKIQDITCRAICNICIGNKKVGLDITNCCSDYSSKCTESCNVC